MILTDDNFASIVSAIREGRGIFDNIRKSLVYLLAGNAAELFLMLAAAMAGWPAPLLPAAPALDQHRHRRPAGARPGDGSGRRRRARTSARDPCEPMLGPWSGGRLSCTGALEASVCLGVFITALQSRPIVEARNLAFAVLVLSELCRAFAARSVTRTFWEVGAFSNVRLLGVVGISVLVQLGIHHIPATQVFFEIGALSAADMARTVLPALVPVTILELRKLARRGARRAPERCVSLGRRTSAAVYRIRIESRFRGGAPGSPSDLAPGPAGTFLASARQLGGPQ
jgi:Ca2+-transporting ATPase